MGIVESAQMAQDYWMFTKDQAWNKRDYRLNKTALNIDLVNTIREDLRDLLSQRNGRIDNLMLVNTLLFSFSFGFVCEGTFLPGDVEPKSILYYYAALMALTLAFPFWSIFFSLECKQKLDHFLNFILREEHAKRLSVEAWAGYYDQFDVYWDNQCQTYYLCAQNFFWLGMLMCLSLSVLLTSVNFVEGLNYPAEVGWLFAIMLGVNVVAAFGILLYRTGRYLRLFMNGTLNQRYDRKQRNRAGSRATLRKILAKNSRAPNASSDQMDSDIPSDVNFELMEDSGTDEEDTAHAKRTAGRARPDVPSFQNIPKKRPLRSAMRSSEPPPRTQPTGPSMVNPAAAIRELSGRIWNPSQEPSDSDSDFGQAS